MYVMQMSVWGGVQGARGHQIFYYITLSLIPLKQDLLLNLEQARWPGVCASEQQTLRQG